MDTRPASPIEQRADRVPMPAGLTGRRPLPQRAKAIRFAAGTASLCVGVVALLVLAGCQNRTSDRDLSWVEPENATAAMMQRGGFGMQRAEPMWLDPRTPELFERGRIPGAINIPFRDLETVYPTIRDRGTIVVYGTGFDDAIAAAASKRLLALGHSRVLTLRGGLQAWERAGNPVESGPPVP